MKHIYAFEKLEQYESFQHQIEGFSKRLHDYEKVLKEQYALSSTPKGGSFGRRRSWLQLLFHRSRFQLLRIRI
ncbi:hypothetical protein ACQKCU_03670 [Heyndrickxia sporothermodurans]